MIGAGQVLSLLSGVLKLIFPDQARATLGFVTVFVADVSSLMQFECYGFSWYDKWAIVVGGVPGAALMLVGARWAWVYYRTSTRDVSLQTNSISGGDITPHIP
eukprot:COSAG01_NODE_1472_length_10197_cov_4.374431_1_plen_103_part_00